MVYLKKKIFKRPEAAIRKPIQVAKAFWTSFGPRIFWQVVAHDAGRRHL